MKKRFFLSLYIFVCFIFTLLIASETSAGDKKLDNKTIQKITLYKQIHATLIKEGKIPTEIFEKLLRLDPVCSEWLNDDFSIKLIFSLLKHKKVEDAYGIYLKKKDNISKDISLVLFIATAFKNAGEIEKAKAIVDINLDAYDLTSFDVFNGVGKSIYENIRSIINNSAVWDKKIKLANEVSKHRDKFIKAHGGQTPDDIKFFEGVLSQHNNCNSCSQHLGFLYKRFDESDKAKEIFAKLIKLEPYNYEYYKDIADIEFEQEEYNKAIKYYKKSLTYIDYQPANIEERCRKLYEVKDKKYPLDEKIEKLDKMMEELDRKMNQLKEIERQTTIAWIYFNLGYANGKLGDIAKGKEYYENVISMDKNKILPEAFEIFPKTYFNLGLIYLQLGNKLMAMEMYNKLKKIDADKAKELLGYIKEKENN